MMASVKSQSTSGWLRAVLPASCAMNEATGRSAENRADCDFFATISTVCRVAGPNQRAFSSAGRYSSSSGLTMIMSEGTIMTLARMSCSLLAAAAAMAIATSPAAARCTKLGFSVNDYGKDGPTKDAKDLLDKYIAKWTSERGIKTYKVGKKDVSCDLFLNLIVVDEHTCKATATVCWGDESKGTDAAAVPAEAPKPVPKKKKSTEAPASAPKSAQAAAPATTGAIPAPAPKPAQ